MAKLFSPQVGANFGETFISTVNSERKLRQQQQQFNQDLQFRNRQLDFLNIYRQGLLAEGEKRSDISQDRLDFDIDQSKIPTEFTGDRFEPISSGVEGTGEFKGQKVNIVFDKKKKERFEVPVFVSPDKNTGLTTPFVSGSKLRDTELRFEDFQALSEEMEKSGKDEVELPDGTKLSKERLKTLRKQAFDDVVFETDERSKQLNEIYENFDQAFQKYLKLASDKKLTKDNIDSIVSRDLKGAPPDMIKEMKELLKARVF